MCRLGGLTAPLKVGALLIHAHAGRLRWQSVPSGRFAALVAICTGLVLAENGCLPTRANVAHAPTTNQTRFRVDAAAAQAFASATSAAAAGDVGFLQRALFNHRLDGGVADWGVAGGDVDNRHIVGASAVALTLQRSQEAQACRVFHDADVIVIMALAVDMAAMLSLDADTVATLGGVVRNRAQQMATSGADGQEEDENGCGCFHDGLWK